MATSTQIVDSYCAVTGGALQAVLLRKDINVLIAFNKLWTSVQSKYQLPLLDASSVGQGTVTVGQLVARAWSNIAVDDSIAAQTFGSNVLGTDCVYLLYPRSYNPATWSGPAPAFLNSPEMVLKWQTVVAQMRPAVAAMLKAAMGAQAQLIAQCEASVATWDNAARIATGIATFGLSELVAVCGEKVAEMKKSLANYAPMRAQAKAFLDDPRCSAEQKRQISDAMQYDGLLALLCDGKASVSDATAAVESDPNIPSNLKSELGGYISKVPADDLNGAVRVSDVVLADAQAAPGMGFLALAALQAIPVGTMICIAVIVVALVAGIVIVLGPLLQAIGKAVGAVVSTLGGPGLIIALALGGAGYYMYKNPGALKALTGKLKLRA